MGLRQGLGWELIGITCSQTISRFKQCDLLNPVIAFFQGINRFQGGVDQFSMMVFT
jgi:hypothetical protein